MKVLKGLALSLLSFLLFLSLTVFGFAFTAKSTLLNADFVADEVDKLNVTQAVKELVEPQIAVQIPPEAKPVKDAIYAILPSQEPWLKEQARALITTFYDFMLGKADRLSFSVSLTALKGSLKDSMRQAFMQNLPPEYASLPQSAKEQAFEQLYQEYAGMVPDRFSLSEGDIPPETMAQLTIAKRWLSYVPLIYNGLIAFMLLLIVLTILLQLDVKKITRGLGITFLTFGFFEYASIWAAKILAPKGFTLPGMDMIPPSLQTWTAQLSLDLMKPLEVFSLGCLIGGIVLLVVSFVYPARRTENSQSLPSSPPPPASPAR